MILALRLKLAVIDFCLPLLWHGCAQGGHSSSIRCCREPIEPQINCVFSAFFMFHNNLFKLFISFECKCICLSIGSIEVSQERIHSATSSLCMSTKKKKKLSKEIHPRATSL